MIHDDELRLLVRDAVARHLGAAAGAGAFPAAGHGGSGGAEAVAKSAVSWKTHLSHGRFVFLAPTEPNAPCVVEPEVRCQHCGFCQSYGH